MIATMARPVKFIAFIASFSFLFMGFAKAASPLGPYTAYKLKVTALVSMPTGAYVYFDSNHQCGAKQAFLDGARSDYKTLYSTLLTAQTNGLLVAADLRDSSTGSCNGGDSKIANLCVGDASGPCFTGW